MRIVVSAFLLLIQIALVAGLVFVVRSVTMSEADAPISKMPGGALSFQHQTRGGAPFGSGLSRLMAALQAN